MKKLLDFKKIKRMPGWLGWLLAWVLRIYVWTLRVKIEDPEGIFSQENPGAMILPFWHNRIIFIYAVMPAIARRNKTVLISSSRDGEYITTFIRNFGIEVIRGSSTRGGTHALMEMDRAVKEGHGIAITVDGPRGPRYSVKPGAAWLAQKNQVPIVPVSLNSENCWSLHSWDGTQIPKPFSRVTFKAGKSFIPAPELPMEEVQKQIGDALHEIEG